MGQVFFLIYKNGVRKGFSNAEWSMQSFEGVLMPELKVLAILGGGGAKGFGHAIFPFGRAFPPPPQLPCPVINYWSLSCTNKGADFKTISEQTNKN